MQKVQSVIGKPPFGLSLDHPVLVQMPDLAELNTVHPPTDEITGILLAFPEQFFSGVVLGVAGVFAVISSFRSGCKSKSYKE